MFRLDADARIGDRERDLPVVNDVVGFGQLVRRRRKSDLLVMKPGLNSSQLRPQLGKFERKLRHLGPHDTSDAGPADDHDCGVVPPAHGILVQDARDEHGMAD